MYAKYLTVPRLVSCIWIKVKHGMHCDLSYHILSWDYPKWDFSDVPTPFKLPREVEKPYRKGQSAAWCAASISREYKIQSLSGSGRLPWNCQWKARPLMITVLSVQLSVTRWSKNSNRVSVANCLLIEM